LEFPVTLPGIGYGFFLDCGGVWEFKRGGGTSQTNFYKEDEPKLRFPEGCRWRCGVNPPKKPPWKDQ